MRRLLNLALLLLSLLLLTIPKVQAQEAALDEEIGAQPCTQEQADQGQPIGLCTFTNGCTGYNYYQYAPKASEKHGQVMCIPSACSEPVVSCPTGVEKPNTVPSAPTGTIEGTNSVGGVDFSTAATRLIGDTASSCPSVLGLFDQAKGAYSVWQGLNYGANCPTSISDPWSFLSGVVTKPESGLARDFIPKEANIQPASPNPVRGLLDGFLNFFKSIWGLPV